MHQLDAVDAYALTLAEDRRAETAGCRREPDMTVGAMPRGREHMFGERVHSVATRDERDGQRFEHPGMLKQSRQNVAQLDRLVTLHAVSGALDDHDPGFGVSPQQLGDILVVDDG